MFQTHHLLGRPYANLSKTDPRTLGYIYHVVSPNGRIFEPRAVLEPSSLSI